MSENKLEGAELKKIEDLAPEDVPKRRVRFLMINPQDFLQMFTKGLVIAKRVKILKGVPEDAKVIQMTVDHVRGGIILVVESQEYDEIPQNEMPPVQYIALRLGADPQPKKKKR